MSSNFLKLKREFCTIYNNLPMNEASYYEAFYTDIEDNDEADFLSWGEIEALDQWVNEIRVTELMCDQVNEVINRRPINQRGE